ncbi:hypothetical protein MXMO3_01709 [Maritalea myrionectae]|uniref:Uncharacterized protein n=1 Tax=Maritalea myrionectae TaxID=454601 RepID=A0A2R4ME60_9HYPH|nr:hypothetical protein [Maritalea myrionectae]AVX04235.1 hypothetical protein MXMO3_01709 [Maritalea myrionectae]
MTKDFKRLPSSAIRNTADYSRAHYHVNVGNDVTLEDLLKPVFWSHHDGLLLPGTLIDVLSSDFSLDVQLRVISNVDRIVKVRVLRENIQEGRNSRDDLEAAEAIVENLPEGYKITHSNRWGYAVDLDIDGKASGIAKSLETKEQAVKAAQAHFKEMNGETDSDE